MKNMEDWTKEAREGKSGCYEMSTQLEKSNNEKVKEFHNAFGQPVNEYRASFVGIPQDLRILRRKLIEEEFKEYMEAEANDDFVETADALIDMLYVIEGALLSYGMPSKELFNEVHRSNMSKLDENGKPVYREDGKVIKSKLYSPPDIKSVLEKQIT